MQECERSIHDHWSARLRKRTTVEHLLPILVLQGNRARILTKEKFFDYVESLLSLTAMLLLDSQLLTIQPGIKSIHWPVIAYISLCQLLYLPTPGRSYRGKINAVCSLVPGEYPTELSLGLLNQLSSKTLWGF